MADPARGWSNLFLEGRWGLVDVRDDASGDQEAGETRRPTHHRLARPSSRGLLSSRDARSGAARDSGVAGHASISVTQRYMHLARSALTEAVALLENRIALTTG
jgi:hypothetical protein